MRTGRVPDVMYFRSPDDVDVFELMHHVPYLTYLNDSLFDAKANVDAPLVKCRIL